MKRLLAAGCGDIWQICKVYRDGESGRWHNPEFTMIEWYRVGYDHHSLMSDVERLISAVLPRVAAVRPRGAPHVSRSDAAALRRRRLPRFHADAGRAAAERERRSACATW